MGAFSTAIQAAAAYARNSPLPAGVGAALGRQLEAAGIYASCVLDALKALFDNIYINHVEVSRNIVRVGS